MSTPDLTLMSAMLTKMNWMEERQKVLAQNIANSDTPNYQPQDVKPLDFKALLKGSASSSSLAAASGSSSGASATGGIALAGTDSKHFSLSMDDAIGGKTPTTKQKSPYETSPSGNSVILEEQLIKMNQNYTDYEFTSNLYQKNITMLKDALK